MPEPLRKLVSFLGALCLVAGLIAVVLFLVGLASGDVSARGLVAFVLGALAIVLVPRLLPVPVSYTHLTLPTIYSV